MERMIIFDDGRGKLGPMTDLRAAFEVRTGMYTTAGRMINQRPKTLAGYWVPEHLRKVVAERANGPVNELPKEEAFFCVNGRWAMLNPDLDLKLGEAAVEDATGQVIAARLRHADAEYFLNTGHLHERVASVPVNDRVLYRHPWDVIAVMDRTVIADIQSTRLLDTQVLRSDTAIVGGATVEVHKTAQVMPNVTLDATNGPIIIHEHATVRPGAVICGPCSIGRSTTIMDRALIKSNTVIGPHCKVGGEVGGTIFQGYSNKSHDGHLGDSWVGKWVNFGAGTTNSNLLNTYGEVFMRVEVDGPRHRTGLSFLGAIIGDHAKLAICTRLMTGSVIGTGAMIATAAHAPTTVRRFAWITDEGERVYRFDKFRAVMRTMMARRDAKPSEAYEQAVEALYRLVTRPD